MLIHLLRHAIAVQRGTVPVPNDDRPLTEEGIAKMEREALGIIRVMDEPDVILTSPLVRAFDTATITAKAFHAESKVQVCKDLLPGSSLKNLLSALTKYKKMKNILIVGHEPDLSYFACALLGKQPPLIELKKGSLCCIEAASIPSHREGKICWLLTPKQLRLLAKKGITHVWNS